jgi:hypothetical protein
LDEKLVYASEDQADEIQQQRWVRDGIYEEKMAARLFEFARIQNELVSKKLKKEKTLTDNSIRMYILYQDSVLQRSMDFWTTYSNTLQEMAILSLKDQKYDESLLWFFESLFLNLHGPSDVEEKFTNDTKEPFDRSSPEPIDSIVQMVSQVAKKGEISEKKLKDIFYQAVSHGENYIPDPIFPHQAWKIFNDLLQEFE